jgi:PBP1b-binding outer membrane lipoprotein LpoB
MDRRSTLVAVVLGLTFLLAGCQQQAAVSIDEAKEVTASFEGQDFLAPPRSIADITASLDQHKPDPAKAAVSGAGATNPALGRTVALQQVMLGLIDSNSLVDAQQKTVFSYAHPIFWAPFLLVGDSGGQSMVLGPAGHRAIVQRSSRDVVS